MGSSAAGCLNDLLAWMWEAIVLHEQKGNIVAAGQARDLLAEPPVWVYDLGSSRSNRAVKCLSCGGCWTMRKPPRSPARSATAPHTSIA